MTITKSPYFFPALLSFAICALLCATSLLLRPAFPVDETRYLTVAWEMYQSGNWILPTLNLEAYHHKPPVLFWLINLMWTIFGVSQQSAMLVPYLAGFSVLMLTARLSTRLFPDMPNAPLLSVALLGGSLPFVIYSNLIMFDLLLSVFVMVGVTAIWDYFKTGKNIHLLTLAVAIGLGAITKGPVILLHLAPAIIFMKLWTDADTRPTLKSWLPKFLGVLLLGVAIGLCWAIPAAIEGGKEFAEKIFYGQTAGRMVNAFDHKQPAYWYVFFIPLLLMPWIFMPIIWQKARDIYREKSPVFKFLSLWILSVFMAFCAISGKQVHYLLPLLPPISLLMTSVVLRLPERLNNKNIWSLVTGLTTLILLPHIVHGMTELLETKPTAAYLDTVLEETNIIILPAIALLMIAAMIAHKGNGFKTILTTSLVMAVMMCGFQFSVKTSFFKHYDLTPIAQFITPLEDRPMAFAGNYAGEFGFMARRSHAIAEIERETIADWFAKNPTGIVIVFDKVRNRPKYDIYTVLFEMPFRMTSQYMILELKK